jgi:hypothetical protein
MEFKIADFVPRQNNTLRGFFTLIISDPNSGLEIAIPGLMLHKQVNQRWIEFPGKQDKNGNWSKVLIITDKALERAFKQRIMRELDNYLEKIKNNDLLLF